LATFAPPLLRCLIRPVRSGTNPVELRHVNHASTTPANPKLAETKNPTTIAQEAAWSND